nr:MAG TPA: hypothetical protein [Caudoviricetes sp.]
MGLNHPFYRAPFLLPRRLRLSCPFGLSVSG